LSGGGRSAPFCRGIIPLAGKSTPKQGPENSLVGYFLILLIKKSGKINEDFFLRHPPAETVEEEGFREFVCRIRSICSIGELYEEKLRYVELLFC
jgi:hypothetical protein